MAHSVIFVMVTFAFTPKLLEAKNYHHHRQAIDFISSVCEQPLFPRDKHTSYLNLPAVMQFESDVFRSFESYWEISNNETYPIGCLKIEGNENKTKIYIQSSHQGCSTMIEIKMLSNTLILPAFAGASNWAWPISYSLFIKAEEEEEEEEGRGETSLIIQLNQREGKKYRLIQQQSTQPIKLRRLNMTTGGPRVRFGGVRVKFSKKHYCIAMTECDSFGGYGNGISLGFDSSDSVVLIPIPPTEKKEKRNTSINIRVALSKCFSYQIGQYYYENSDFSAAPTLRMRYSRDQRYHTLYAIINKTPVVVSTKEHYGLDCSKDWFQLNVKNVYVIPNCWEEEEEQLLQQQRQWRINLQPTPQPTHTIIATLLQSQLPSELPAPATTTTTTTTTLSTTITSQSQSTLPPILPIENEKPTVTFTSLTLQQQQEEVSSSSPCLKNIFHYVIITIYILKKT